MLNLCSLHAEELDIKFNAKKSCLFKVGRNFAENISNLQLGGSTVEWSDQIKYLGVRIITGKCFKLDSSCTVRKFYAATNAIYSRTKHVQELPRLHLFESFTLPILTYGCDGLIAPHSYLNKLNVCWNNVYRKIFGMNKWETVKCVQMFCERLDFIRIFET